jgi:hypothetical protein
MPKLEVLARELETFTDRKDLARVIEHIRNDAYPIDGIVRELIALKMKYFAQKLKSGYYELNKETQNDK